MNDQKLTAYVDEFPFPHMIIDNFYTEEELELIWEELKFYTKPGKLLKAKIMVVLWVIQVQRHFY